MNSVSMMPGPWRVPLVSILAQARCVERAEGTGHVDALRPPYDGVAVVVRPVLDEFTLAFDAGAFLGVPG